MPGERKLNVLVNPLAFLAVDEPWVSSLGHELSLQDALEFLCTPGRASDLKSLIERYREISTEPKRLFAVPAERQIVSRLVWPLRHAKGCYMVGNPLGTVALCGMVAEMLAILLFEVHAPGVHAPGGKVEPMDVRAQEGVFGHKFERLGQERRVRVLRALGLIDDKTRDQFDIVRRARNRYLHSYSVPDSDITRDAVNAYGATVSLIVQGLGLDVKEGKLILSPAVLKYLERIGAAEPAAQPGTADTAGTDYR